MIFEVLIREALRQNCYKFGTECEYLTLSAISAPSLAMRVGGIIDALECARWPSPVEYLEELKFCISIALEVDWSKEASLLPTLRALATLTAPFNVDLALRIESIYNVQLGVLTSSLLFGQYESSEIARGYMLRGAIAKAERSLDVASACFASISRIAGLERHLQAIAGLERFTITQLDTDLAYAHSFIEQFPHSSPSQRLNYALRNVSRCSPDDFSYFGMYGITSSELQSACEV